jgi:poly(3-hydroxybutyrate) depolymerase
MTFKNFLVALAAFAGISAAGAGTMPEVWTEKMPEQWKKLDILVKSTADGTMQPASFYIPPKVRRSAEKIPLLVALHSWSYGYEMKNPASWAANECTSRGWAMLYPHFRGPNKTPQGCGSDLAVQDIVDQIKWALANHPIDPDRVYILGGSGGGHMALIMAGRHPELFAGVYSACPITDIARWRDESDAKLYPGYARMIESACGGKPDEKPQEYARRSPLTWIKGARDAGLPVSIIAGIRDGHKRKDGGSVPVGHSIRAYNILADEADRISDAVMEEIEKNEKIPAELVFKGVDPYFSKGSEVLMRVTSGNVQLTIFNAGHAGNYREGAAWRALQRRGRPADWKVSASSASKDAVSNVTK